MSNETAQKQGAVRPTMFVGLGGTGKEVLLRLRRRFYESYGVPALPCTSFLWIDTDTRNLMAQGEKMDTIYSAVTFDEKSETVPLLSGNVGQDLGAILENRSSYFHDWLHPEVARFGREIADGAGGVRAVGRMCWIRHYSEIRNRIKNRLDVVTHSGAQEQTKNLFGREGTAVQYDARPQAWIVCSLAGGTGCGTVLDTAFLLRDMGIETTYAVLVMPNVFYGEADSGELAQRSLGNGYAALMELENYVQNLGSGSDLFAKFKKAAWIDGDSKEIMGPPFSAGFVVERRNERPIAAEHRGEVFRMLAESLYLDFMPGPFSDAKRSEYSNVSGSLSGVNQSGSQASRGSDELKEFDAGPEVSIHQTFSRRYATIGMSKMTVPVEQLRMACAARLAQEICGHWGRKGSDPNVRESSEQEASVHRLFPDQIFERFPGAWREMIDKHYEGQVRGKAAVARPENVEELATMLATTEELLARADGQDATKWGRAIDSMRKSRDGVQREMRAGIREWVESCLQNQSRGLQSVLDSGGYLDHLDRVLRSAFESGENQEPSHSDRRLEEARADAVDQATRRDAALQQLREAVRSPRLKLLGTLDWTLGELVARAVRASHRRAMALASAALWQEVPKAAKEARFEIEGLRRALGGLTGSIEELRQRFADRKASFSRFSSDNLFAFIYDDERDWKDFYALDIETETDRRKEVNAVAEATAFLRQVSEDGAPALLPVLERLKAEGAPVVERDLLGYAEERFEKDFRAHQRLTNVLQHPQVQGDLSRCVERICDGALPMTYRVRHLRDQEVNVIRCAHLGVGDAVESRAFVDAVKSKLSGMQLQVHDTGDPTAVYLYMVSYAFPLPSLPLISQTLHDAYHGVYRAISSERAHEESNKRLQIPLHLSWRWEGSFKDLRVYDDAEARTIRRATEAFLRGMLFRVLSPAPGGRENEEFYYLEKMLPRPAMKNLGGRKHALEELRRNERLATACEAEVRDRCAALDRANRVASYWCFAWMKERHTRGTPEHQILQNLTMSTGSELQQDYPDEDLAAPDGVDLSEYIDRKLGDSVDRTGDWRVLKLSPAILPRL